MKRTKWLRFVCAMVAAIVAVSGAPVPASATPQGLPGVTAQLCPPAGRHISGQVPAVDGGARAI